MAVWRRLPQDKVLTHPDQSSQYTSHEWQAFLDQHGLQSSMNAVVTVMTTLLLRAFFGC